VKVKRIRLLIGVSLVICLLAVVTVALASTTNPTFPKNQNGQTYGSAMNVTSVSQLPDLIKAQGTNGQVGYVRAADLLGTPPKSPQEAVAQNSKFQVAQLIPLYSSDGKTVIGSFKMGGGHHTP
jgi:hypothetical protein